MLSYALHETIKMMKPVQAVKKVQPAQVPKKPNTPKASQKLSAADFSDSDLYLHLGDEELQLYEAESDFVKDHTATIWLRNLDDKEIKIGRIKTQAIDVKAAVDRSRVPFYVFDNDSQTLANLYFDLYLPKMDRYGYPVYRKSVVREIMELRIDQKEFDKELGVRSKPVTNEIGPNILFIRKLEILPEFRGHNYGLEAMRIAMHHLGKGTDLTVLYPYPLQHARELATSVKELIATGMTEVEAIELFKQGKNEVVWENRHLKLDAYKTNKVEAYKKMVTYCSEIGFGVPARSKFMVMETGKWERPLFGTLDT